VNIVNFFRPQVARHDSKIIIKHFSFAIVNDSFVFAVRVESQGLWEFATVFKLPFNTFSLLSFLAMTH
jgi:hypothetical protein